jgi:hypothetical protein
LLRRNRDLPEKMTAPRVQSHERRWAVGYQQGIFLELDQVEEGSL